MCLMICSRNQTKGSNSQTTQEPWTVLTIDLHTRCYKGNLLSTVRQPSWIPTSIRSLMDGGSAGLASVEMRSIYRLTFTSRANFQKDPTNSHKSSRAEYPLTRARWTDSESTNNNEELSWMCSLKVSRATTAANISTIAISGSFDGSSSILARLVANCVCRAWRPCHTASRAVSVSPNLSGGISVLIESLTAAAVSPSIATTSIDKRPESAASLHSSCLKLSLPKICLSAIFGVWERWWSWHCSWWSLRPTSSGKDWSSSHPDSPPLWSRCPQDDHHWQRSVPDSVASWHHRGCEGCDHLDHSSHVDLVDLD